MGLIDKIIVTSFIFTILGIVAIRITPNKASDTVRGIEGVEVLLFGFVELVAVLYKIWL